MLTQAQVVAQAMLLEDYLTPRLPPWLHTALDVTSLVPIIDIVADGLNSLLYWSEGDYLNAGICAGSVFVPGLAELPAKGLKWLRTIFKIGAKTPTATVWDFIKAGADLYPGTNLPQAFTLDLGNGTSIWVNYNATKHINEYVSKGRVPMFLTQPITEQTMLLSLREAVKEATKNGVKYTDEPISCGGWELLFGEPDTPGFLPTLIHALPQLG